MEKNLQQRHAQLQQAYPQVEVPLWTMDEHRVGLKSVQRRAWFPWWLVPTAPFAWRFQWCWVYGFVRPDTGETDWWLLPKVSAVVFSQVLAAFAQTYGIDPHHPVLLVLDQAAWHTSSELQLPPGLHLEFLPPYSPELQPAERLWPLLDEPVVNKCFDSLEALEDVLAQRCQQLAAQPELISRWTCFHWWPLQPLPVSH